MDFLNHREGGRLDFLNHREGGWFSISEILRLGGFCMDFLNYREGGWFSISERSQTWKFLYGFLKPKGRGYGFLSGFPPFFFRGCEFYEIDLSRQRIGPLDSNIIADQKLMYPKL